MARPLRIEMEDGLYHVTSRGNNRQAVFRDAMDFERRVDWIRRTVETYGWHINAYALMNNHDLGRDSVAVKRQCRQFVAARLAERLDSPWCEAVRRVERHPPGLSGRLAKIENAYANH